MAVSAISHSLFHSVSAISFFILCLSCISFTEAQKGGFSVELIHRDSPKSPFFNPDENPFERIVNALRRSSNRVKLIDPNFASLNSAQADIIPYEGEFLMKLSIGTPPVEILAVADTGSDLIWTQCKPCLFCYKQDADLLDPSKSSSYKDLSCKSKQCGSMRGTSCSFLGFGKCKYSVSYGDKSHSYGNLATDTITLDSTSGRPVVFPKTIIGCGHRNAGTFSSKAAGIVGLGGGNVSLVSQMDPSLGSKFSYCLVHLSSSASVNSSKINFGSNGVVSGSGVVSTPLIARNPRTFYFLTLEAISVGNKRIAVDRFSFGTTEGNIIIDSGTTLTYLPQAFNSKLVSAVSSFINATPVAAPKDLLDLCYNFTASDFKFPEITVHFTSADVKLNPLHTFVRISEELSCLTFKGVDNGPAIYGNLMQKNFLVGYDTRKRTVSFKPTDCTKQ
ncbi:aspartic proteinase CDR1-like [Melia azedarach]|uniref:Aspartic proteinase CDR1-like n=3 Tax=Melia azedarach TaxID=155640 RepID=A0ACC1YFG4_MELAZ|nr:aspartic proteinase CDR1-like [Melia azedarach]KAJ4721736.1 aspartic proteinase CDR1-like [Melia azedarach]KAJ4721739.1 aspartic proteinase CDR1-like [Melia azedarach]